MKKLVDIFREQRHHLQIELDQVSRETKIPKAQLENLEAGHWQFFGSNTYLIGIAKKYAAYLQLDPEKINSYLKREIKQQPLKFIRVSDYQTSPQRFSFNWAIYILVFLVFAFFGLQIFLSWQKPLLKLEPVSKTAVLNKPFLIKGKTEVGALLYLNDEPIYQNEHGNFSETLYFKTTGERKLVLKAIGINGKEEKIELAVKVKRKK
jgi:hypothetical protein